VFCGTTSYATIAKANDKKGKTTYNSIMPLYQAIVLAIIQGFTEFLPVSSTAHLTIIPDLLHWKDPGLSFDVALHLGTLVAVLVYFFRDWVQVILNGFGISYRGAHPDENSRSLLWLLALGTIPAGLAGLKFEKYAEETFRSPYLIGGAMIVFGLLMWVADRASTARNGLDQMTGFDAITVGLAQALAIIPGVSRSGSTLTMARFRGFSREASARFSFLLSTPIIAGAAAKKAWEVHKVGLPEDMRIPYLVGIAVSGVVGLVVIAFFMKYLRRNSLSVFVWYRIAFGIIVIALAFFRVIGG
jgi:undecaprenyl-diphosphatase